MLHFYDRDGFARALTLDLKPRLKQLLATRIGALTEELKDYTEYLVVEPGDSEADIVQHIGLSPLVEPIDATRFGGRCFYPHWDYLADHQGVFEFIFAFGAPTRWSSWSRMQTACRRNCSNCAADMQQLECPYTVLT